MLPIIKLILLLIFSCNSYANGNLYVFVSSSMGRELLRNYCIEAEKNDSTIVFNGLVNGSFKDFAELIYYISNNLEVSIILDNTLFEKYKIDNVPAFILEDSNLDIFDKIEGNIGIKSAIETFEDRGDVK